MRTAIRHTLAALAGAGAISAVAGALAYDPAQAAAGAQAHAASGRAHATGALNITDTAHLHFVRETASSLLIDEGRATGGLPGTIKVAFEVAATVKASFTLISRYGELIGSGLAKPHSSGQTSSFAGTLTITHGTGRYASAHGKGGFYGTFNRGNDAATVQTTGTLQY